MEPTGSGNAEIDLRRGVGPGATSGPALTVTVEARMRNEVTSVARVRTIVAVELATAGCDRSTIEDAELLASELATNAVRHATGTATYVLTVHIAAGVVRVTIADSDPAPPGRAPPPAPGAEHGRGIWLVEQLASRWGVEATPPGKSVWFELEA